MLLEVGALPGSPEVLRGSAVREEEA
jgi:hypothetical protein